MGDWYFTRDGDGWRWHHVDRAGDVTESSSCFPSLLDCIDGAMKNGYVFVLGNHTVHGRSGFSRNSGSADKPGAPDRPVRAPVADKTTSGCRDVSNESVSAHSPGVYAAEKAASD